MDYLYFHSNAKYPLNKLSNFSKCKIVGNINNIRYIFPSAEHYYFAHYIQDQQDIIHLTINGKLGTFNGLKFFYTDNLDQKIKYWKKKVNIGIVAKLFKNQNHKVGIKLKEINDKENEKIWHKVLNEKFRQSKELLNILIETSDNQLVEFNKNSKEISFYTAKIIDGNLIGNNYMGKKITEIRDNFKRKLK